MVAVQFATPPGSAVEERRLGMVDWLCLDGIGSLLVHGIVAVEIGIEVDNGFVAWIGKLSVVENCFWQPHSGCTCILRSCNCRELFEHRCVSSSDHSPVDQLKFACGQHSVCRNIFCHLLS